MTFKRTTKHAKSNVKKKQNKSKKFVLEPDVIYDEEILDMIARDPVLFETPEEKVGLFENRIRLDIETGTGSCFMDGYLYKDGRSREYNLVIEEFSCHPKLSGAGRNALRVMKQKLGKHVNIIANPVTDEAYPFWIKMYEEKLVDGVEHVYGL